MEVLIQTATSVEVGIPRFLFSIPKDSEYEVLAEDIGVPGRAEVTGSIEKPKSQPLVRLLAGPGITCDLPKIGAFFAPRSET